MTTRGKVLYIAGGLAGILLGLLIDERAYHVFVEFGRKHESGLRDWMKLTWLVGFLPLWLFVAAGIGLAGRGRLKAEAWALVAAVVTSGLAGYAGKVLLRRERPGTNDGAYGFRSFAERTFADSGLGLPSGHACLAFAAAWTLSRICPRGWPLWYLLAVGCGLNRLLNGRHFVSDVWVGAFVGCLCASLVWTRIVSSTVDEG